MEKNTITIEIKREAAIMLVWLVVGVTLVTLGFLFGFDEKELWLSLNTAGIVTSVYLIALLFYALRKPLPLKTRVKVGIFSALVLVAIASTWIGQQEQARWQKATLLNIRGVIGRGIMLYQIPEPLLQTLETYHQQGAKRKESLGQVFQRLNPGAAVGLNIHKRGFPTDSLEVFVQSLNDRRIVLVGQEAFVKGKNPQFKNYDGRTGMIQEAFMLTEKGIVHESQN